MKTLYILHSYSPRISEFLEPNKKQIEELAVQAAKALVDFYDSMAMKSVNKAIINVNDLLIVVYAVQATDPDLSGKNTQKQRQL